MWYAPDWVALPALNGGCMLVHPSNPPKHRRGRSPLQSLLHAIQVLSLSMCVCIYVHIMECHVLFYWVFGHIIKYLRYHQIDFMIWSNAFDDMLKYSLFDDTHTPLPTIVHYLMISSNAFEHIIKCIWWYQIHLMISSNRFTHNFE